MGLKIAICQKHATKDSVGVNLGTVLSVIEQTVADLYVFPEMFLTGYGADYSKHREAVGNAIDRIRIKCIEKDIAIAIGSPTYRDGRIFDSLIFISRDDVKEYDKIHLAQFGLYEEAMFHPGNEPVTVEYRGMTFGLSICYDAFFPELFRKYAMSGADAFICASASATASRGYFEKILPARALENVSYLIFANNTGNTEEYRYFGGSRLVSPLGETPCIAEEGEEILCVYIDRSVIDNSRGERHHLSDIRRDIPWNTTDKPRERY